jgi:hypothetical protein
MEINWVKVSEIVFEAVIIGIFSGLFLLIGFLIGRRQVREEQKEKEEIKLNLRRIDVLTELQEIFSRHSSQLVKINDSENDLQLCLSNTSELIIKLNKYMPLFFSRKEMRIYRFLEKIRKITVFMSLRIEEARDSGKNVNADYYYDALINSRDRCESRVKELVNTFG